MIEWLAQRLPMRAAAADRAVVDADHPITPDKSGRLAGNAHVFGRKIRDPPRQPMAKRAIALRHPRRHAGHLDPHIAAVTASLNAHGDVVL